MTRLLNKLNVLVKSNLRNILPDLDTQRAKRDATSDHKPGTNLDQQISLLRKRINAALDQEEETRAELDAMQQQIAEWDAEADRALQAGDETTARYNIRQIQLTHQQHALLAADLDQHRRSTAELIREVNALEAAVAQAQQTQLDAGTDEASLADRLHRARQKATGQTSAERPTTTHATNPETHILETDTPEVDAQTIEDDLNRRRKRLSL